MCGIAGVIGKKREKTAIGSVAYSLLTSEQHRGSDSAGISILGDNDIETHKGLGPAIAALPAEKILNLQGYGALTQNRYAITGSTVSKAQQLLFRLGKWLSSAWKKNAQPFFRRSLRLGDAAIVQNGNLTNARALKTWLRNDLGLEFKGETDTEVILVLIMYYYEYERMPIIEAVRKAMTMMKGAYSCLLLTKEGIIAFRDKKGFRPLEIAEDENYFYFISEPCACHLLRAKQLGQVEPGEIIEARVGGQELIRHKTPKKSNLAICIFCYIYLMAIYNPLLKKIRDRYGQALFRQHPLPGLIISMMESGQGAALGYHFAQTIGLPGQGVYDNALPKDPGMGRSFLEAEQPDREAVIRIKYHFLLPQISDKIEYLASILETVWIIIVDDSLVRGTTCKIIIKMIRECFQENYPHLAHKIKIAWLVSSPPYKYPCYMGIDTYAQETLITWRVEQELKAKFPDKEISQDEVTEAVRQEIGADKLGYLSVESAAQITAEALGLQPHELCRACFTGDYPIPVDTAQNKESCA